MYVGFIQDSVLQYMLRGLLKSFVMCTGNFECLQNDVMFYCRGLDLRVIKHEAEYYGITPLGMIINTVVMLLF